MKRKIILFLADFFYLFFIFFFCYTLVNKLINIHSFRTNLIKTSLFDENSAYYFSYFVLFIEFSVIITLLFLKEKGLLLFCFVILIFTLYISYLKFKGYYEVCWCGGILNGLQYKYHLSINLSLIVSSIYSYIILYIFKVNEK